MEAAVFANTVFMGVLVSFLGGVVAASHNYSRERRNIPPTFDWVDFLLLTVSGTFSGFIGYLLADWWLEDLQVILAIAGLSAIGGYGMLVAIKDMFMEILRLKFSGSTGGRDREGKV